MDSSPLSRTGTANGNTHAKESPIQPTYDQTNTSLTCEDESFPEWSTRQPWNWWWLERYQESSFTSIAWLDVVKPPWDHLIEAFLFKGQFLHMEVRPWRVCRSKNKKLAWTRVRAKTRACSWMGGYLCIVGRLTSHPTPSTAYRRYSVWILRTNRVTIYEAMYWCTVDIQWCWWTHEVSCSSSLPCTIVKVECGPPCKHRAILKAAYSLEYLNPFDSRFFISPLLHYLHLSLPEFWSFSFLLHFPTFCS